MKRLYALLIFACFALAPELSLATNGDNLIGVGPISRAMGGVGIANPQDAISAVFSNPAAMCFGAFCPSNQVDFAGTAFIPDTRATITSGPNIFTAHSDPRVFPIPALGISFNIPDLPKVRFGFGAYGVTGLGVDYKGTSLDQPNFFNFGPAGSFPLAAGAFTNLQILKFAPTVAYQFNDWLSLGAALNVSYSNLDLRNGQNGGFAVGTQVGAIIKPHRLVSIGFTYTSPQEVNHHKVLVGANNVQESLALSSPNNFGVGVAYEAVPKKLLLEVDFKFLNWANANGYRNFDWGNQYVVGAGVQYKPIPKLALRMGYNYGNNPVNTHNNFVGATANGPTLTTVQGNVLPTYYFETFRTIGFPAIVEHHLTLGVGYEITERFTLNIGYMHAFENSITEHGTNLAGQPTTISSKLVENGIDFGFSWRF